MFRIIDVPMVVSYRYRLCSTFMGLSSVHLGFQLIPLFVCSIANPPTGPPLHTFRLLSLLLCLHVLQVLIPKKRAEFGPRTQWGHEALRLIDPESVSWSGKKDNKQRGR